MENKSTRISRSMIFIPFFQGFESVLPLIIVILIDACVACFLRRIQAFVKTHSRNWKPEFTKITLNQLTFLNGIHIMTLKGNNLSLLTIKVNYNINLNTPALLTYDC